MLDGFFSAENFTDVFITSLLTGGIYGYVVWKVALGPLGPYIHVVCTWWETITIKMRRLWWIVIAGIRVRRRWMEV